MQRYGKVAAFCAFVPSLTISFRFFLDPLLLLHLKYGLLHPVAVTRRGQENPLRAAKCNLHMGISQIAPSCALALLQLNIFFSSPFFCRAVKNRSQMPKSDRQRMGLPFLPCCISWKVQAASGKRRTNALYYRMLCGLSTKVLLDAVTIT